jgi:hypothetical protein
MARMHAPSRWNEGHRLEPHSADAWSDWEGACPLENDTEARLQLRIATANALDRAPRDPRFWQPQREAMWLNDCAAHDNYIPTYGVSEDAGRLGQSEEWVRRPTVGAHLGNGKRGEGYVALRSHLGRRTTPLIAYDSLGWNRRHYEPIPDRSRSPGSLGWWRYDEEGSLLMADHDRYRSQESSRVSSRSSTPQPSPMRRPHLASTHASTNDDHGRPRSAVAAPKAKPHPRSPSSRQSTPSRSMRHSNSSPDMQSHSYLPEVRSHPPTSRPHLPFLISRLASSLSKHLLRDAMSSLDVRPRAGPLLAKY